MDMSLEVDSVLHSFDGRTILTDIYLQCQRGDIIGLFGRNGTGKTTLFRIIFGELKADRSFIRIDGEVIRGRAMSTGLVTYVPQFNYLPGRMRVKKVVDMSIDKDDEFYNDFFYKRTRLLRVNQLSEGEQRYLAIILALKSNAPYLILDEPFKAMSPLLIEELIEKIKTASNHKGIILTDHRYQQVYKVANKYMLLKDTYLFPISTLADLVKHGYYRPIG